VNNKLTISIALLIVVASIFAYYYFDDVIQVARVLIVIAGVILAGFVALQCDAGKEAWVFAKGANVERQKVVWPTRKEAMMVTVMVMILVIIIGLFIALVDKLLFETIYNFILGVSR